MNLKYWEWRKKAMGQKDKEDVDMTGFCMCQYERETCHDCPTETECIRMIQRGHKN